MKCLIIDAVHEAIAQEFGKTMQVDHKMLPTQDELKGIIGDYDVLIMRVDPAINKEILDAAKNLKVIGVCSVGLNHIDMDYAKEKGGSFDVVTARAVARLNILSELCLPLVKINGYFVAMKGQSGQEELAEAVNAISILGGKIENVIDFELPDDAGKRSIVIIKKVKDTPKKYPRQFAKIKERPL